jgi:hypothetical protein
MNLLNDLNENFKRITLHEYIICKFEPRRWRDVPTVILPMAGGR